MRHDASQAPVAEGGDGHVEVSWNYNKKWKMKKDILKLKNIPETQDSDDASRVPFIPEVVAVRDCHPGWGSVPWHAI